MKRVPVESSCVASIGYDPTKRELEIEFLESSEIYRYIDVPPEEHAAFMAANSKGTYLNEVFKPKDYRCHIIREENLAMTNRARIEVNPEIMLGKPVIRGTRIPVELILRKLSEGATESDLLDAYPGLAHEDIQAAIGYAADAIAHEEIVFVEKSTTRRA